MTYCQDCGAAKEYASPVCRNCGSTLTTDGGSAVCPACQQHVGEGATFCGHCGAPLATADSTEYSNESPVAPATLSEGMDNASDPERIRPNVGGEAFTQEHVSTLELPAWLRQVGLETPANPVATEAPASEVVHRADRAQDGERLDDNTDHATLISEPESVEYPPHTLSIPPLPDGGLDSTMPAWLREAHSASDHASVPSRASQAEAVPAAISAPVPAPKVVAQAVPVAVQPSAETSTDTTSFISETDLPEWLRNLAAADATKAEVTRIAQEAEAARQGTSRNDGKVENPGLEGLPGDAPFTPASSSSWLARGETVARPTGPLQREEIVTQASGGVGRRAAFADVVSAYTPRPTTHGESALHDGEVIARATSPAKPAPVVETIEEQKTKTGRRVLLIMAALVAIVAMLLVAYALGATGV